MTDDSRVYPSIGDEFAGHSSVNHSAEEYVRLGGFAHTNTVESHFALLKRGVYGTFHNISEAHLRRYLAEFDFRANTRDMTEGNGQLPCSPEPRASGSCTDSLTKPRTAKQRLRAFLRWRACRESE